MNTGLWKIFLLQRSQTLNYTRQPTPLILPKATESYTRTENSTPPIDLCHVKNKIKGNPIRSITSPRYVTFRGPCIVIYSYNKNQRDALFLKFILIKYSTRVLKSPQPHQEGNKTGSISGTRAISTTSRRELSSKFFFPPRQGAEGNSRYSDRNISLLPSWSG